MLSSTYKLGDDSMIVDSKDLRNYGIDLKTGQVTNTDTAFVYFRLLTSLEERSVIRPSNASISGFPDYFYPLNT